MNLYNVKMATKVNKNYKRFTYPLFMQKMTKKYIKHIKAALEDFKFLGVISHINNPENKVIIECRSQINKDNLCITIHLTRTGG